MISNSETIHFKVISDSMTPVIPIGSLLNITTDLSNIKTFDIILFKKSTYLVVHFVWKNQMNYNGTIITRSLKQFSLDEEPVSKDQIIGQVTNFSISNLVKFKIYFINLLKRKL